MPNRLPDPPVLSAPDVTHRRRPPRFRLIPEMEGPLRLKAKVLLGIVGVLVVIGVTMVQSAGQVDAVAAGERPFTGLLRQGGHAVIGFTLLMVTSQIPTARIRRYSWVALAAGLAMQLLVYSPLGYEVSGNRNWLRIGPFTAQPSEFMKVILLVWVSAVLATKRDRLDRWQHVVIPVLPVVALSMMINVVGGDVGSLAVIAALVLGCLWFSRVRIRILAGIVLVAAVGFLVMVAIKPNRVIRVFQFFEVDCVTAIDRYYGMCWQPLHGLWALARGGFLGTGLGNSHAKWGWLPEADNDYIFAIIGEELGLLGAVTVILVFGTLIVTLLTLLSHCRDPFAVSILGGAATWILAQMAINLAVVLGFIPVLGVPLPFVSSGGSSLLSTLVAIGVVLSCVREQATQPTLRDGRS